MKNMEKNKNFVIKLKKLDYKVLTTSNEKTSKGLNSKSARGHLQFVHRGEEAKESDSKLTVLKDEDFGHAEETYHKGEPTKKLHKNKKLWGHYENKISIGYVMERSNGSTGGSSVKPELRNKGYGTVTLKEGHSKAKKQPRFSQADFENKASIRTHEKLNCIKCDITVY